jgi:hypothetical protein
MKTNRNISIDVNLLNRVLKRLEFTPQTFTGLVENLLEKWEKQKEAFDKRPTKSSVP